MYLFCVARNELVEGCTDVDFSVFFFRIIFKYLNYLIDYIHVNKTICLKIKNGF